MQNKNEKYQKKQAEIFVTAELVADIVDCSPSLVNQVRKGERNGNKGKGAKIIIVDDLLSVGHNALIEEVKRLVKL